ncbi:MAG: YfiR family protein [Planctomycetaceae bacterium]
MPHHSNNRRSAVLLLIVVALVCQPCIGQTSTSKEYKLKLAFLYKFALYVTPAGAKQKEIRIAVLGRSPFGKSLAAIAKRKPRGLKCVPAVYQTMANYKPADIVFVCRGVSAAEIDLLRKKTRGQPVLIVDEDGRTFGRGGVIQFVLDASGRIKLQLNAEQARARKLEIDARLLRLCTIVNVREEAR